jgi:hypothetical protein
MIIREITMPKRASWYWIVAFFIIVLQTIFILYFFKGWSYDDPYVTFRYAENLYRGLGFVYNPGEQVLSTTTPSFTMLLWGLRYFSADLPRLAFVIGAIALPTGGLFLWDLTYTHNRPLTAWISLLLYPIFPLLLTTLGSEMPLFLALCIGAFTLYARSRYSYASVFLALCVLTRPEGILVSFILLVDYILKKHELPKFTAFLFFIFILTPWIIFSTLSFGSPIPTTLAAKQAQGSMLISERYIPGLATVLSWGYLSRWQYWLGGLIGAVGMTTLGKWNRAWLSFIAWGGIHFLAFSLLGVSGYFWYYAPLVPGVIILFGLGVEFLLEHTNRNNSLARVLISSIGLLLLLGIFSSITSHAISRSQNRDSRIAIYQEIGTWIKNNTPKEAKIGLLEIGIMGYFAERTIIDFSGLLQPEVVDSFDPSSTYEDSARWSIQKFRPDYVVLNPGGYPNLIDEIVSVQCNSVATFEGKMYDFEQDLNIYHCE